LAQRLDPGDVVYLTGQEPCRIAEAGQSEARAKVALEALDVSDPAAIEAPAGTLAARPGGVDHVLSNHYSRAQSGDNIVQRWAFSKRECRTGASARRLPARLAMTKKRPLSRSSGVMRAIWRAAFSSRRFLPHLLAPIHLTGGSI
jgi:hypothetical protein